MATGATDFSEYPDGADLRDEDWTAARDESSVNSEILPDGPFGKRARFTREGGSGAIQLILGWDAAPNSTQWQTLHLMRVQTATAQNVGAALQVVGVEAYVAGVRNNATEQRLFRVNGSTFSESLAEVAHGVDVTEWFWQRAERDIDGNILRMRTWQLDGAEPSGWDAEVTTSAIQDAGSVGIVYRPATSDTWVEFGYFAYDSEGGSVPIPGEAEDQPTNLETLNITATSARASWDAAQ